MWVNGATVLVKFIGNICSCKGAHKMFCGTSGK